MVKCLRCLDTGFLVCGPCHGTGIAHLEGIPIGIPCQNCGGSGHTNRPCNCGAGRRSPRKPR